MLWLKIIGTFNQENFEKVKSLGTKVAEFLEEEGIVLEIVSLGKGEDYETLQHFKNNNQ